MLPPWLRGTFLCIFGSTLTALGLVLQKRSHEVENTNGDDAEHQKRPYYMQKWWVIGFSVFLSAQIINMVAMAMTPQVILSCLGAWTLVCNVAFAQLVLGEAIGRQQAIAVVGLVLSTVLVISTAPHPAPGSDTGPPSFEDILGRFLAPQFDLLCLFMGCLGAFTFSVVAKNAAAERKAAEERLLQKAAGGKRPSIKGQKRARLSPLAASWATLAALAAGFTAMLFKCVSEIVAGTLNRTSSTEERPAYECWQAYLILAAALCCAPSELHCLNMALQHGDAVAVVPMYLSLAMLAQLATGGVFFQEFSGFLNLTQEIRFALSVCLTLACVVYMTQAKTGADAAPPPVLDGLDANLLPRKKDELPDKVSSKVRIAAEEAAIHEISASDTDDDSESEDDDETMSVRRVKTLPNILAPKLERKASVAGFAGAIEALQIGSSAAPTKRSSKVYLRQRANTLF
eukprot:TRINITY_DN96359_c0_g1_i1.p1 TRINITY_DN96359_c0_g1~~TRINITY_DN96359_c0_g1_i1.p1  ORF type:complete len:458 (+),score=86.46 TRINITY_DN96359_c0_g1_i1:1-1374(+)